MSIPVKYFASLKDHMGRDHDVVTASEVHNVADVWTQVSDLAALPENTLAAVNMEYVEADHPVEDGD